MKNTWTDRTNLRKYIILERKKFYLRKIMDGELSPVETEEVIDKIAKCNEILFHMKMDSI